MTSRQENVKWVDGLRGLASVLVVFTHLARTFDEDLFKPASEEGATPRVAQWPIIRILFQGRIGVTIFCLVTGYVCALKPIRQSRAGNHGGAFTSISKGAFRRIPRLFLPTTIATVIIWFFCQFGVFSIANSADSWWLNYTSPNPSVQDGLYETVTSLLTNLLATWTSEWNAYDPNQWTLPILLHGAMLTYLFMLATMQARPMYRMILALGCYSYYYAANDSLLMQFFFGIFLSDLAQVPSHTAWCQARKWPSRILAPILLLIGLILASYPEDKVQWVRWSEIMGEYSVYLFPENNETPRYYSAIGLQFIALAIHFSPSTKDILSNKYLLWFGKNSFAVYLLHGAILRTFLVWMVFGLNKPADVIVEDGTLMAGQLAQPSRVRFWSWLPIWFVLLYAIANLWTKFVDPWCAKTTEFLAGLVFEETKENSNVEKETLLPR